MRDSLYNLALTEYMLADYEFARVHCEDLYRQDPDNKQVSVVVVTYVRTDRIVYQFDHVCLNR